MKISILFILAMVHLPTYARAVRPIQFAAPSVRSYLAYIAHKHKQTELNGVMRFCQQHHVAMDRSLPITKNGERIFLSGAEVKIDKTRVQYRGHIFHAAGKTMDALVQEVSEAFAAKWSAELAWLPQAYAESGALDAGSAVLLGAIVAESGTTSANGVVKGLGFAGVLANVGGFLAQAGKLFVTPARADDTLPVIQAATCDQNGVTVVINGKLIVYTLVDGQLQTTVDGASFDMVNSIARDQVPGMVNMVNSCLQTPQDPADFTNALNNMLLGRSYKAQSGTFSIGNGVGGGMDTPTAQ